jgi:tripeptidyl-peptidase-1
MSTPSQIFSLSYQDFEDSLPPAFMTRLNTEFAQLAMRGTTLVTGSGDWGVGCTTHARGYTVSTHRNGSGQAAGMFRSDFPSSSPYVVSVGATTFPSGGRPSTGSEIGVPFSSGGFSNHFARPAYQSKAIPPFIAHTGVPPALFNASGRGFPDVSAVGVNFQVVINGRTVGVGGTSASSPTFAAILSRVNTVRLAAGKATLGWANPWLYAAHSASPSAFHDVTRGNNAHGACEGFNATAGWDPMTGLGTPNWSTLITHA